MLQGSHSQPGLCWPCAETELSAAAAPGHLSIVGLVLISFAHILSSAPLTESAACMW